MEKFDELKTVWLAAKTASLPKADAARSEIKKFRGKRLQKKWMVIICSCLLVCLMLVVLVTAGFQLPSTYAGGSLIMLAVMLLAYTNFRSLKRFNTLADCSNLEFLSFVEQTRQNQLYYYKKTQVRIMTLCLTGLLLYLYEPFQKNPVAAVLVYAFTALYFLILWIWLRPRFFKKDARKLDALICRLENLSKQLK